MRSEWEEWVTDHNYGASEHSTANGQEYGWNQAEEVLGKFCHVAI